MPDLSNLVGNTGIPAMVYYTLLILGAVFMAGWHLKGKLRGLCADGTKDLEERMQKLENRLEKHISESVTVEDYNKDMKDMVELVREVKHDFNAGITSITSRIDSLTLLFTKTNL